MKHKNTILFFSVIFTIISIITWSHLLFNNKNNIEGLVDMENSSTTHTVNLPINTTYSCSNMCGSQSKCYITGGNCLSDIDCPGCNPRTKYKRNRKTRDIPGNDSSGKFSYLTPQYSSLTSDHLNYGNYSINMLEPAVNMDVEPNLWKTGANMAGKINKDNSRFIWGDEGDLNSLQYPVRQSATGLFRDNGPLPSNAIL